MPAGDMETAAAAVSFALALGFVGAVGAVGFVGVVCGIVCGRVFLSTTDPSGKARGFSLGLGATAPGFKGSFIPDLRPTATTTARGVHGFRLLVIAEARRRGKLA